jgi:predicted dehydrogenase
VRHPLSREPRRADLRVGVVGMGRWGRRLIETLDRVASVAACVNRGDAASAQWLAGAVPTATHSTDATAMLGDQSIDAIAIVTPIDTHADLAIAALEAGKHVFVEKPLATSEADCDRVILAAERADRHLFVGYTFLYDSALEELHAITRADRADHLRLVWHKFGTFEEALTWNLLTHHVAVATWLFREDPSGVAVLETASDQSPLDRIVVRLDFGERRTAEIEVDRARPERRHTAELVSASGARLRWDGGILERADRGGWRQLHAATERPLERELRAFVRWISEGAVPPTDGLFGRQVTATTSIVEAAARAGAVGSEVAESPR